MMVASAASAEEYHCSDRNGHGDELLRELYTYALFAEAADRGKLPSWQCEAPEAELIRKPQGWDAAVPKFQRLTKAELKEYGWSEIANSFRDLGRNIGAYIPEDGGPVYVVCDDNPRNIKLFLTWSQIRANIEEFFFPIVVPVVLDIMD